MPPPDANAPVLIHTQHTNTHLRRLRRDEAIEAREPRRRPRRRAVGGARRRLVAGQGVAVDRQAAEGERGAGGGLEGL